MMRRLRSSNAFRELQERLAVDKNLEIPVIVIPTGTCGQASGANDLIRIAKREILSRGLRDRVHLRITGCHGFCQVEPLILVEPERTFYPRVTTANMVRIVEAVSRRTVLEDLLFLDETTGKPIEKQEDIPFFKGQTRTILARSEKVDPIRIYTSIENGGYSSLVKVMTVADPEWVIQEVKESGLRGRGGAGFPTGLKWEMLARQAGSRGKFLVCNADEGDPGAYMDRSVIEGNPHSIIEGMLIGAFGTGASEGVIYVRNEYPLAIKHLLIALRQARELGLLGKDILGSGFSFDIKLVKGAGAFVCGEETALIASIEGKMGEPRQRPPFPIEKGIDGKPTVINNVETWANIPIIIEKGARKFAEVGRGYSSGTKIFSLVGKVKYTGLVEVPMGTSIRTIVHEIGGGAAGKGKIKGVQTGGPSGGCIPAEKFDLPIDYDSLAKAGSIMGSGGMIVMDENTCLVDVAKYFMSFLKDESCGKCFTCRKGTQRMYEILDDITRGKGTLLHLDLLEQLALAVKDTTMCGLGQTASNPVLNTLRYFRKEYEEHIIRKKCRAFVCTDIVGAPCQTACPLGTEVWRYVAHIHRKEFEEAYRVIREPNPFPSVCARVCNHLCEDKCRAGASGGQAVSIRALKRFVTDRVDPSLYKPKRTRSAGKDSPSVAVIGSGPAGLSAAHYLSLAGYRVTIFEKESQLGGMLRSCIPPFRLPRELLDREISALIDENISIECNSTFGSTFTFKNLFDQGFKAIFLALGAHRSRSLAIDGEEAEGVYTSLEFLKSFNLRGVEMAKGRVGIIGGGNSAVDAARVAIRYKNISSVTIIYRRTREEMPAYEEEIEALLEEGVVLKTLLTPVKIHSTRNKLSGLECIRNTMGAFDSGGRRIPVPIPGSEFVIPLDTLIVAVGEQPDTECCAPTVGEQPDAKGYAFMGVETRKDGTIKINEETLSTSHQGVFAGGDAESGPDTVINAIATGKKAAHMIDLYISGNELKETAALCLPEFYIEAHPEAEKEPGAEMRTKPPVLTHDERMKNFNEVESSMSIEQAIAESGRCIRCDLQFTHQEESDCECSTAGGNKA